MTSRICLLLALGLMLPLLGGCSHISKHLTRVKPWERETHARRDMRWEIDKNGTMRRSHIYFSKEASLSGGGSGGGGCGCN